MILRPLDINGEKVRSLTALQEKFNLTAVLECYKNGKLLNWLQWMAQNIEASKRERYESAAISVEALDENTPEFVQRLCAIFEIDYSADMEIAFWQQERLAKLRTYTDDAEVIGNIALVAFDQEELAELLQSGAEKIYLCRDSFVVPASQRHKTYIGVNNPAVHIGGEIPENWAEQGIVFVGCTVDNLPEEHLWRDIPDHIKSRIEACAKTGCSGRGNMDHKVKMVESMLLDTPELFTEDGFKCASEVVAQKPLNLLAPFLVEEEGCKTTTQMVVEKVTEEFGAFFKRSAADNTMEETKPKAEIDPCGAFVRSTRAFAEGMMKSLGIEEE